MIINMAVLDLITLLLFIIAGLLAYIACQVTPRKGGK